MAKDASARTRPVAPRLPRVLVAALLGALLAPLPPLAAAAETVPASARYPAQGLPIIDCAPPAPAPADSCVLRLPASDKLGQVRAEQGGAETTPFRFARSLPAAGGGTEISKTLVLLDLSPGPEGGRNATWKEERRLIAHLLRAMPADEPVALYGFNEKLESLSGFTRDHAALADLVEGLDLQGTNTRIATFAREGVELLGRGGKGGGKQDGGAILRNLIVITDGQEEGDRSLAEVNKAAVAHGVTIASLGMLWRPVGDPVNGAGMDFLSQLSEGTRGATQSVQLRRPGEARTELDGFIARFNRAMASSGLILPEGTPAKAEIQVTLQTPVPGQPGSFAPREIRAQFVPSAERGAKSAAEPTPEAPPAQGLLERLRSHAWMGIAQLWWLIGAAVLGFALIALGIALLASRRAPGEEVMADPAGAGDAPEIFAPPPDPAPQPDPVPQPAPAPPPPAIAYLIRDDDGTRLAIRAPRVIVGRGGECDIVLPDASVSRSQCEISREANGGFAVRDTGSLNGTILEGRKLSAPAPLKAGDRLTLGDVDLRFSPV